MTTSTWSTYPNFATDAQFQAWGQGISGALAALGLVQTGDTGQIDFGSVTRPSGTYAYKGYEVWRFADALQATHPIFLKVEYGASNSSNAPGLRITVGKGTDGAATMSTAQTIHPATGFGYGGNAATFSSYASASPSGISLSMAPGSGYGTAFTVERSLNTSGAPTGDGVALLTSVTGSNINATYRVARYTTGSYTLGMCPTQLWSNYSGVTTLASTTSASPDGINGITIPIPLYTAGVEPWLSAQHVACLPGDVGASTLIPVTLYGATTTFRGFPYANLSGIPVTYGGTPVLGVPAAMYWT